MKVKTKRTCKKQIKITLSVKEAVALNEILCKVSAHSNYCVIADKLRSKLDDELED